MPPLHPNQGFEVRLKKDAMLASLMDTPVVVPDTDYQSGSQPDFFDDEPNDDEYFEFHPRSVRTINSPIYPSSMGDVERLAGYRAESIHVEFPDSLHGLLAWTVTIEGTDLLREHQELVTGLPGDNTGPWMLIPNNVYTPTSRHLQGAYSALSDRVGRWPKTNEQAQQLVDAWSAKKLLSNGFEIPGLMVASAVEVGAVQDIVDGLRHDGVDEAVAFRADNVWRILSYVPVSERASVSELRVDIVSAKPFGVDAIHVGAVGGA